MKHEIITIVNMSIYLVTYFIHRKIGLFIIGLVFLLQVVGIDLLVYYLLVDNYSLASRNFGIILLPLIVFLLMRDRPMRIGDKKYAGFGYYFLLFDTDLKYIISLFLLSFFIDIYFRNTEKALILVLVTTICALLFSMPFGIRMKKLEENKK